MPRISAKQMAVRDQFIVDYFQKHPHATLNEANEAINKKTGMSMGVQRIAALRDGKLEPASPDVEEKADTTSAADEVVYGSATSPSSDAVPAHATTKRRSTSTTNNKANGSSHIRHKSVETSESPSTLKEQALNEARTILQDVGLRDIVITFTEPVRQSFEPENPEQAES